MKRFLNLALLTVLLAVGLSSVAGARAHNMALRYPVKMAGVDSNFVSLPNGTIPFGAVGAAGADPDTTEWVNLGGYNMAPCRFDNQAQAMLYVSVKATAPTVVVTDSIAVVFQFALDNNKTKFYNKAAAFKPCDVDGNSVFSIMQCDTDIADPSQGSLWVRAIIGDGDLSRTAPWESVFARFGAALDN